jgi:hypothetical protein
MEGREYWKTNQETILARFAGRITAVRVPFMAADRLP